MPASCATAPFRGVSTPDGYRTAPGTPTLCTQAEPVAAAQRGLYPPFFSSPGSRVVGEADRPRQHHGVHPPAVESAAGDGGLCPQLPGSGGPLPAARGAGGDGCPHAPVLRPIAHLATPRECWAPQSGGAREQRAAVELAQAVRTGASGCAEVAPTCEPPSRSRPSWSSASKRIHAVVAALGQCRNHVHNQLVELV